MLMSTLPTLLAIQQPWESGDPSVDSRSWPRTELQIWLSKPSFEFCKAGITLLCVFISEGENYFHIKTIAELLTPRTTSLQRRRHKSLLPQILFFHTDGWFGNLLDDFCFSHVIVKDWTAWLIYFTESLFKTGCLNSKAVSKVRLHICLASACHRGNPSAFILCSTCSPTLSFHTNMYRRKESPCLITMQWKYSCFQLHH